MIGEISGILHPRDSLHDFFGVGSVFRAVSAKSESHVYTNDVDETRNVVAGEIGEISQQLKSRCNKDHPGH